MTNSVFSRLPLELHSSAHQLRHDGSLLGEYEVRIYRGVRGPVVVLEVGSSSALPLEYLSEIAVDRLRAALPSSTARYFERHIVASQEVWVEVGWRDGEFFRVPCTATELMGSVADARKRPQRGWAGHS